MMNIESLYKEACENNRESEKELFKYLSVSFHMFILRRVGNRQDAEEILQNTLMAINEKFRAVVIVKSFGAWAYEILKNQLMAYYKSKKLPRNRNLMLVDDAAYENDTDDLLIKRQLRMCLKKVNKINKMYARILNLHSLGFSTAEICQRLDISQSSFYTTLFRARKLLTVCLEKGDIN